MRGLRFLLPVALTGLTLVGSAHALQRDRQDPVPLPVLPVADRVSQQIANTSIEAYRLITAGQLEQAAELLRQAFALAEGRSFTDKAALFDDLAWLYMAQGKFSDAESLLKQLLQAIDANPGTRGSGENRPVGTLATLYVREGRYREARPLAERALAMDLRERGARNAATAESINVLATIDFNLGATENAEKLYLQALRILMLHPRDNAEDIAQVDTNLADCFNAEHKPDDALQMSTQAYKIFLQIAGPDDARTLTAASHVAVSLDQSLRFDEAASMMQSILPATQKAYGPDSVETARALTLAGLIETSRSNPAKAVEFLRPALAAYLANRRAEIRLPASASRGVDEAQVSRTILGTLLALNQIDTKDRAGATSVNEAFLAAQEVHHGTAESALSRTLVRLASGDSGLAQSIRRGQDLAEHRAAVDRALTAALSIPASRRDSQAEAAARRDLAQTDAQIADIAAKLKSQFPDYDRLADPEALPITAVQKLLKSDEALVFALPFGGPNGEATFVFVVTADAARWRAGDLAGAQLVTSVHTLLCGLDPGHWESDGTADFCKDALGLSAPPPPGSPLPFEAGMANKLFDSLFGDLAPMLQGKSLLVVAPDPLASLPFEVLVTSKAAKDRPEGDDFRHLAWLGRSNAISVLPSVTALQGLRARGQMAQASLPYIGFGDPTLIGSRACPHVEAIPDTCPSGPPGAEVAVRAASRGADRITAASNGQADLDAVRALCPLPETALELRCVAESLKVSSSFIHTGDKATVPTLLSLDLSRYRVIHFATHGLLAGEIESGAGTVDEPALVLTPPPKETEGDDGLLRASTIAGLKLNADWVVLSACDTAAANSLDGEAMSGLASAFFYAGARALLVSHWPVDSEAAVRLTTGAFAEMRSDPRLGRAEALRRSRLALMDGPDAGATHPSVWAPFSVVGEGGAVQ